MHHLFIVNPTAGKGKSMGLIPSIEQAAKRAGADYEIHITQSKEDGIAYARKACETHPAIRLYACGGDGTLNDIVYAASGFPDAEIGMIPCGTGNDFIKCLGDDLDFLNFDAQLSATSRRMDLVKVGDKDISINITNIGMDADAAYYMTRFRKLPLITGAMAYYLGVLTSLIKPIGKKLKLRFDNGEEFSGKFMLAAICNGKIYGGGYMAAPLALQDDGLFDLCLVKSMTRAHIVKVLGIYKAGKHLESPIMQPDIVYRQCKWVEIVTEEPIRLCIDGEILTTGNIRFEIKPAAVRFITPQKSS